MESITEKFKFGGLGILAAVGILIAMKFKAGDAPSPEVYAVGAAGGLSTILGFLKNFMKPSEGKEGTALIEMVKVFIQTFGANSFKAIYDAFKTYGVPVYINGVISWGKGKTYPLTIGKDPEKEGV